MIHSDMYKVVKSKNISKIISIINDDNEYCVLVFSCYFKLLDVVCHMEKYHHYTISKNIFLYYGYLNHISMDQLKVEDFFTFHPIPLDRCIELVKEYNTNKVVCTAVLLLFTYYNYYDPCVYSMIDNEHLYICDNMKYWANHYHNKDVMNFIDQHYNNNHQYYGTSFIMSNQPLTDGSNRFPGLHLIAHHTSEVIKYMEIDWAAHYYYMDDFIEGIDDED